MDKNSKKKSYTIRFEHRAGYLYVYGHALKDSFDTSVGFWTDIAAYCKDNKFTKVLVEEDFATDNSMIDMYEIVSRGHETGFTGIKIAFVDRHSDQMNANLFGETVAQNRGLIARVFPNVQEAEAWLLS